MGRGGRGREGRRGEGGKGRGKRVLGHSPDVSVSASSRGRGGEGQRSRNLGSQLNMCTVYKCTTSCTHTLFTYATKLHAAHVHSVQRILQP